MNKFKSLLFASLVAGASMYSCSDLDNSVNPKGKGNKDAELSTSAITTSSIPYLIDLVGNNSKDNGDGTYTWTYEVTKIGSAQDISHFSLVSLACDAQFDDITGISYSHDGVTFYDLNKSVEVDKSQTCVTTPVLKFDVGGSKVWYAVTFNKNFDVKQIVSAYKSGSKTGCGTIEISGPGCEIKDIACTPTKDETSFAGILVNDSKSWFAYIPAGDSNKYDLLAGQHHKVGTVQIVNGRVYVDLASNAKLQSGDNFYVEISDEFERPQGGKSDYKEAVTGVPQGGAFDRALPNATGQYIYVHVNVTRCE
jgi:hypothetical protein